MKSIGCAGLLLALSLLCPVWAQDQQQAPQTSPPSTPQPTTQQQETQPEQTTPAPTAKPPRVIGQPQTQEELNAWVAIEKAATFEEKGKLAEDFLVKYPESGLTPFAHQLLAFRYQQANNFDKFAFHAEKALEELPQNPILLSALSAAYAQKGQADKATDRAQKCLQTLDQMPKPAQLGEGDWMLQKDQLAADAHYALGVAHVTKYQQAPAPAGQTDANLTKAAEELTKAVELDPSHDRAYYHLGFAFARQNNGEKAIESYARAVALGGIAQSLARDQLQRVYQFVYKNTDGLEQTIATQKEYVQKQVAEKRARAQSLQPQTAPPAQPGTGGQQNPPPQP
ncbi:MAG: tetratricopeptide repeat protein [Acidobacteriota bacterium]